MHDKIHKEEHLQSSDFLRDVVIGMSDGLTVPFALAAGLTGAVANSSIVVIAGIAEIVAGSIAMGLGGFLAGKTENDHYNSELRREYDEVEKVPEMEKKEVRDFFESMCVMSHTITPQGNDEDLYNFILQNISSEYEKFLLMGYEKTILTTMIDYVSSKNTIIFFIA